MSSNQAIQIFALTVGLTTSSTALSQIQTLEKLAKDAGYRLYQPPRENWGPGTVFLGRVSGGKLKVERAICPSMFKTVAPVSAGVLLPDYSGTSDTDISLGISLLEKVVGPTNTANLQAGYRAPRNVTIKWGPIAEEAYFASSVYTSSGQTADVDAGCRAAIADVRARGRLKNLFVIDRALKVASLTYTFKRGNDTAPSGATAGGDLKIAGIINLTGKVGVTVRDETNLIVTTPLYIAYARPVTFADFAPQAQVSGQRVRVRLTRNATDLIVE